MPRRPRIHLNSVPPRIVQRSHQREPCFFAEDDYSSYLHGLGEALIEAQCALHADVLMINHVHLLLTPNRAEAVLSLAELSRQLARPAGSTRDAACHEHLSAS